MLFGGNDGGSIEDWNALVEGRRRFPYRPWAREAPVSKVYKAWGAFNILLWLLAAGLSTQKGEISLHLCDVIEPID